MQTAFILSVGTPGFHGSLFRTSDDAPPVVAGDIVELWPSGLRAKVRARTLLSGLRAFEVYLDMGFIPAESFKLLREHGWETSA